MYRGALWIVIGMVLSASISAGTTAEDFAGLKKYAKSLSAKPLDAMQQFKPETTFKNYDINPEQKSLYKGVETEKTDLTGIASNALQNDAGGQAVIENFGKNQFDINQNNDAIKRAKLIEDESYAITHNLSNDRIKCDEKPPVCEMKSHVETCFASKQLPKQQCVKKRQISVESEHVNQRVNVEVVIRKKWAGNVTINLITGAISGARSGNVSSLIKLKAPCEGMSAAINSIKNNGDNAYWVGVIGLPTCVNQGLLTLNVNKGWDRAYPLQIALTVNAFSKAYVADEHWTDSCSSLEKQSLCHVQSEQCSDANETRIINGLPVARDCWEKTATFSCASSRADECVAQKEKQCLQATSHCARMENNECALYEQTYNCFDKVCPPPITCVKDLFCADGDCTEHAGTENNDFGKETTPLAVVGAAGREYGQTQTTLFGGHAVHCKKVITDFVDCCSEEGWGQKINIAHCPDEDKALGRAKLDYLAHYIGEYCADKVLGVCTEYKRTYCVFNTKMARIIQEEGRLKQLNSNALGTAEHPTCEGISVAELQSLDMGRIEFLKPVYPFNSGVPTDAAGIVVPPPNTGNINDEIIRRVQKKVGSA